MTLICRSISVPFKQSPVSQSAKMISAAINNSLARRSPSIRISLVKPCHNAYFLCLLGLPQFACGFDNKPRPAPQKALLARVIRPEAKALFRVWHVYDWHWLCLDDAGQSGVSGLWRADKKSPTHRLAGGYAPNGPSPSTWVFEWL